MKRFNGMFSLAVAPIALLMVDCGGGALTADRARAIVQTKIDQDEGGRVSVNIGALVSNLNNRTPLQPQALPTTMQRLLTLGYLNQETVKVVYPDLSGQWRGPARFPYTNPGEEIAFEISMNRNARPPSVSGKYFRCTAGQGCFLMGGAGGIGGVNGNASSESPTQLTVTESTQYVPTPSYVFTAQVSLQHGPNGDQLVGKAVLGPGIGGGEMPLNLQGSAGHGSIEQEVYKYTWSGKLPSDVLDGAYMLRLGRVKIDSCENLLLGSSDTNASGTIKWHVDLESAQKAIMGNDRLGGMVAANFRKQPDGKWVVESVGPVQVGFSL